jgi:DNA-binding NarL/FixJ family response regulator
MINRLPRSSLTQREKLIIALSYLGLSDAEIGEYFGVLSSSIQTYQNKIHRKLGFNNTRNARCQTIKWFLESTGHMPQLRSSQEIKNFFHL